MTTILVVDDDKAIAQFLELNLSLEGFEVVLAYDGEQALVAAKERSPDLALLDVMLPRIDGMELCRRLRADPATVNLPVIMLTARAMSGDQVAGLLAGADDYIAKPFDTLELVTRIRATLRRHAEVRSASPLTGLPGSHRVDAELARRLGTREPVAVCDIDLDNFESFNDRYGFLRGDELINLLASALQAAVNSVGATTAYVGHLGGDDFVLLARPADAVEVCRRLLTVFDAAALTLHDPLDTPSASTTRAAVPVCLSIGIAFSSPGGGGDAATLRSAAVEMKVHAQGFLGSAIAVDRRGAGRLAPAGSATGVELITARPGTAHQLGD